jgi:phosphoglycerate dehydrogenase-like enzyme
MKTVLLTDSIAPAGEELLSRSNGVVVANLPGINAQSVAE